MLQALGGKLISRDMAMRELPFTVNVTQELEKIEIEDMRAALLGSLTALSQAIPQMAMSGGDASAVVRQIADVIKARQGGKALEDAIEAVFTPPPQQVPPAGVPGQEQMSPATAGAPVGGPTPEAAPQEQAAPQGQQMPPAAPPSVQSLLSSLSGGGNANASVRTVTKSK